MRTETTEQIDELPEDFAAAWATVLLDLWEKRQSQERRDAEQSTEAAHATVMEEVADGE